MHYILFVAVPADNSPFVGFPVDHILLGEVAVEYFLLVKFPVHVPRRRGGGRWPLTAAVRAVRLVSARARALPSAALLRPSTQSPTHRLGARLGARLGGRFPLLPGACAASSRRRWVNSVGGGLPPPGRVPCAIGPFLFGAGPAPSRRRALKIEKTT